MFFTLFPEQYKFWVNYVYLTNYLEDGENYIFETSVKNVEEEGGYECRDIIVTIIGENGIHEIFLADRACLSMAEIFLSEKYISGLYNDISKLSHRLEGWNLFHYESNEMHFKAFINDTLVFESDYSLPIGNIIGFRYRFRGTGSID